MNDPSDRTRRQHEPIWPLSRDPRTAEAVAAHTGAVRDRIAGARNDENLAEIWAGFNVPRFLQEIGSDTTAGLAEPLRDVENTDLGLRAEPVSRKLGSPEIEPECRRLIGRRKERVLYRRLWGGSCHRNLYILATMSDKTRLDKWLWAARFYKTRSIAISAIENGRIEVNGDKAKPAKALGVGDRVRVRQPPFEVVLMVKGLSERRGPAVEAAKLYEELPESIVARQALAAQLRTAPVPAYEKEGRPTKKDRRLLDDWRGRR